MLRYFCNYSRVRCPESENSTKKRTAYYKMNHSFLLVAFVLVPENLDVPDFKNLGFDSYHFNLLQFTDFVAVFVLNCC